jgi:hypothetical protein
LAGHCPLTAGRYFEPSLRGQRSPNNFQGKNM